MNRQKFIQSLILIACDIGALYSLAHTRSVGSFLVLTAVMIIAVITTVDWYTTADVQSSLLADESPPAPSGQTPD
jgi:hypothetical protein